MRWDLGTLTMKYWNILLNFPQQVWIFVGYHHYCVLIGKNYYNSVERLNRAIDSKPKPIRCSFSHVGGLHWKNEFNILERKYFFSHRLESHYSVQVASRDLI